jgi:hypothetical protein
MKNRAKCKLCSSVIESFHPEDYVTCKCGEIAVDGGDALKCIARNWENFIRIDDKGNEIIIKVKEKSTKSIQQPTNETSEKQDEHESDNTNKANHRPSREELLDMLSEMIKSIENLPPHAMSVPVTQYDFYSLLSIILVVLKEDCN